MVRTGGVIMKTTHLCQCQAGFIARAKDRFAFPAANLPGHHIGDLVTFQECAPACGGQMLPPALRGMQQMVPNGKEATYQIVKALPHAPDGSRVPFILVERVQ